MSFRKWLVLAGVAVFGSVGDCLLSRGMKEVGPLSLAHLSGLFSAIFDPFIVLGILFLLGFFASYTMALSWADLTYVLPASSLGYVLLALMARFLLHEQISLLRWLGILLISAGVGFVTRGPALTHPPQSEECVPEPEASGVRS
ncbi:MAG TPA: EamA family transporter [Terriglobales bacterium]|nr:EamA family transporter [Terriglobales bacterium]